jgi:CRISPR-associated protein Csb2
MFILGIHYLNGWAMATHPADRERPEWPPHPDRVFMALAAAYFETEGDDGERDALEWLEKQPPPTLWATPEHRRTTVTTFVPVNDQRPHTMDTGGSLPIGRVRQPRGFPVAIPYEPLVFLSWKDVNPTEALAAALDRLASKVAALGHSASLVQMWVGLESDIQRRKQFLKLAHILHPVNDSSSRFRLRIWGEGRLRQLEKRYSAGLRPISSLWQGYAETEKRLLEPEVPGSFFDNDLIVLRQIGGRRFGLTSTLMLANALRTTLISGCSVQPPPEWLSGFEPNGGPGRREYGHIAILPLPHVGRPHADGHLLGLAIAVPRDVPRRELYARLSGVLFDDAGDPKRLKLNLGGAGECVLEMDEAPSAGLALQPQTWLRPSKTWASVTPVALDRHTGPRRSTRAVGEVIARSCVRIGLPVPETVIPSPVSRFIGAPSAAEMPKITRKNSGEAVAHTHVELTFPSEVQGPVLIGSGRYRGYGLFRPIRDKEAVK